MKKQSLQKEVLVVISSGFTKNELTGVRLARAENTKNFVDELEEACWDGLLDNLLPPLESRNKVPGKLFIWQLFIGDQFVCADMAEEPFNSDNHYSVNPLLFFKYLSHN